jgi:hypothetical protein
LIRDTQSHARSAGMLASAQLPADIEEFLPPLLADHVAVEVA